MSVNYNTSVLNSRLQDVANAIDAGGGPGVLRLLDSGSNIVVSMPMSSPCGTVSGGVLTFTTATLFGTAAGGTAISAQCEDSTGTVVISGLTVDIADADIILSPTNIITGGQVVALTAASIIGR